MVAKHEAIFPIVGFLARHILNVVGFQIEIEILFFFWLKHLLTLANVICKLKI